VVIRRALSWLRDFDAWGIGAAAGFGIRPASVSAL